MRGRALRPGADAPVLIVGGDDRVRRYRHPMAVGAPVRQLAMAVVVARRGGLHAAATRFAVGRPAARRTTPRSGPVRGIEATCSRPAAGPQLRGRARRPGPRLRRGRGAGRLGRALPGRPDRLRTARVRDRPGPGRVPLAGRSPSRPVTRSPGTRACPAAPRPRTPTSSRPTAWSGSPPAPAGRPRPATPACPAARPSRSGGAPHRNVAHDGGRGARPARDRARAGARAERGPVPRRSALPDRDPQRRGPRGAARRGRPAEARDHGQPGLPGQRRHAAVRGRTGRDGPDRRGPRHRGVAVRRPARGMGRRPPRPSPARARFARRAARRPAAQVRHR